MTTDTSQEYTVDWKLDTIESTVPILVYVKIPLPCQLKSANLKLYTVADFNYVVTSNYTT